jgi:methionine synthase II (cobalamin-independent)
VPFRERRPQQFSVDGGYGTTTIGSFPQSPEIRRLRSRLKAGKVGKAEYDAEIDKQIAFMVGVQEALGLDMFVHGEPKQTDMVRWSTRFMSCEVYALFVSEASRCYCVDAIVFSRLPVHNVLSASVLFCRVFGPEGRVLWRPF